MAENEHPEKASGEPAATPNETAPANESAAAAVKSELPEVESPSISPAVVDPVVEPKLDKPAPLESPPPMAPAPQARAGFSLGARGRRNALLAASVALAAAFGAVAGGLASGGFFKPAPVTANVASLAERKAMQQSIVHLTKEIATLKASVESANKSSHSQIAKIGERLARERAEITGSISPPRTVPPAPEPATAQTSVPTPAPRPAQQMAAIERPPAIRPPLVVGWRLLTARDDYALIERHGDIYRVTPGVPVPGLGRIEQIKREDGRWVVVTPRGVIVSMRDRGHF